MYQRSESDVPFLSTDLSDRGLETERLVDWYDRALRNFRGALGAAEGVVSTDWRERTFTRLSRLR